MLPSTLDHKHGLSPATSSSWLSFLSLSLSYTSKTSSPSSCPAWTFWGKVKEEREEERLYLIATLPGSVMLSGSVKGLKLLFSRHVWELLRLSSIIILCCYFFDASDASPVGLVTWFSLQLLGLHQWPKAHSVCWAATLPISATKQTKDTASNSLSWRAHISHGKYSQIVYLNKSRGYRLILVSVYQKQFTPPVPRQLVSPALVF